MTLFVLVKYLHVLLAIVAIGFNASYGIWFARAQQEPEHAVHVLRGIRALDNRFANPAYALLLITGVLLLALGSIPFTTFWVAAALVLYVLVLIVAVALFSPTLRKQIAALESGGAGSPEYAHLSRRSTTFGILAVVIVLVIEFLMVTKPAL